MTTHSVTSGVPVPATVVAAPNEQMRIIQTLTNEEDSVFCVLDSRSRCGTQVELPHLQDDIMTLKIVKKPFFEYAIDWYIEEYEIAAKHEANEWEEIVGVVNYDELAQKVTIVGRSFPVATLLHLPFPEKLHHPDFGVTHDLAIGRVRRLRPTYVAKELFGCVAIVKDIWEKAENFVSVLSKSKAVCMLISIRPLMDLERTIIEQNCRDVLELSLPQAQLYIRDVFIAIPHMEAYVCNQSVARHKIQAFGRCSIDTFNSSYRITLTLDKGLKKQCIDSTAQHAWRVGQELSMAHSGMLETSRKFRGIREVAVVIDKIEEAEDGKTEVTLKPATSSREFFDLATRMKFEFDPTEPFTIGPSENTYSTVIENLETLFDRFFANKKLFDRWRGAAPPCLEEIPDLYEPFSVNGSNLDESRTVALRTAAAREGFTSVEAPPGSGKTFLIAALVALMCEQGSSGSTYISAPTNAAIDNAIAMIHREYPEITVTRRFSRKTEGNLDEKMKGLSLFQMALNCEQNMDVKHHPELHMAVARYKRTKKQLEDAPGFRQGLPRIQAKAGSEQGLKQSYLKALRPKVYGATCELIARRETRIDFKVANELKEGRIPSAKDLEQCVTHLIVDEASQLPMYQFLSMLVGMPIVDKITIVGDSKQLGPYSGLEERSFARKLIMGGELGRVQRGKGTSKANLTTIYRCHPAILKLLYEPIYGELSSGTTAEERNLAAEKGLPTAKDKEKSPVLFVHIDGRCIDGYNKAEIDAAVDYLMMLKEKDIPDEDIAIVCHHRKQKEMLYLAVKDKGMSIPGNTVDSYQGKEAKFVLVLTTKTCEKTQNPETVFHFVADFNRETVALTRAQHQVVIFGQWTHLVATKFWKLYVPAIVDHRALVTSGFKEADKKLYKRVSEAENSK